MSYEKETPASRWATELNKIIYHELSVSGCRPIDFNHDGLSFTDQEGNEMQVKVIQRKKIIPKWLKKTL